MKIVVVAVIVIIILLIFVMMIGLLCIGENIGTDKKEGKQE